MAKSPAVFPVVLDLKVQLGTGFDLLSRDKDLLKFYETQSLTPEVEWVRRRVEKLSKAK